MILILPTWSVLITKLLLEYLKPSHWISDKSLPVKKENVNKFTFFMS